MTKNKSKFLYKQCKISEGKMTYTTWLPISLAIVGKVIITKNYDSAIVKEVYNKITLTHKQLEEYYEAEKYGEDIIL